MSLAPQTSARQAALVLHAVSEVDRNWVLSQLSETDRSVLDGLLNELTELGIPPDRRLLDQATIADRNPSPRKPFEEEISSDPVPQHFDEKEVAIEFLNDLDEQGVDLLGELLSSEPVELIVHFLSIRHWTWRKKILSQFDEVVRQAILDRLEGMKETTQIENASALQNALVISIEKKIRKKIDIAADKIKLGKRGFLINWTRLNFSRKVV